MVFSVVLFITFSLRVTVIVVVVVLLVNLFMAAFVHYWNLYMNSVLAVCMTFALGVAVDYAAHIAHAYLVVSPAS